ncbi:hypothetical protein ACLK17_23885 [Escherichia coli]
MSMKCVPKPSVRVLNCQRGRHHDWFFPQTTEIRTLRLDFKKGDLDANNYRTGSAEHIGRPLLNRNVLGLDVLVHGEASVMTWWNTLASTSTGLSLRKTIGTGYGSRCVKPPIVIGDVSRPAPLPWSGRGMRNR